MSDIHDANVKSKPVLPADPAASVPSESDMDSSLGILSPSEMRNSGIMGMTASQVSNQGCWTGMTRSRTFTRELNDPKAQEELIIEDIEHRIKVI